MPIYEFQCEFCRYKFETLLGVCSEDKKEEDIRCPKCNGTVEKLISPYGKPVIN